MSDAAAELRAALESCALADRGAFGRLLGTGPDLLDLLNRLSTKAVTRLTEGRGCATVLTTNKGRIVERLFVHHLGAAGVLLIAGPGGGERVASHLARYTFAEDTGLADVGEDWFHLALIGPAARRALEAAGLPAPEPLGVVGEDDVHVLGQDGLSADGVSVAGPRRHAEQIRRRLGVAAAGDEALEAWRVLRGLPAAGHELSEEHNPLEAGLWDAVDFDKGCYVGQEVVARLKTYDKVASTLVGFRLAGRPPERGTFLFDEDRRVGVVTSALVPPGHDDTFGLAYVKRDRADPGTSLRLDGDDANRLTLHTLPFEPAS